jgi:hypothetical protein
LIYGREKIGKSTFCANLEIPYFIDTEHGLNCLSTYKTEVESWETFKELYKEFKGMKGKLPHRTLIMDTVDNLYQMCRTYMLDRLSVNHESDLDFGKAHDAVQREFNVAMMAYRQLGMGVIYTSHVTKEELTTRTGKYTHFSPSMQKGCSKFILPSMDFVLFADSKDDENGNEVRVLRTKPSKYWVAGDKTGMLPEEIPLDTKIFMEEFKKAIGGK